MRFIAALLALVASAVVLVFAAPGLANGKLGFGFNAPDISGFPHGAASLTGGGSFDPATASLATTFVHSSGGFRCTEDVAQGPLAGCLAGQGVRWDTAELLARTSFKCTGAATEALKTATTGENTVVLQSDFYRAGDGIDESFTAPMIVSENDIAPDVPGVQNVWIAGVGCGSAVVSFSR
jgi:hypothetical protein